MGRLLAVLRQIDSCGVVAEAVGLGDEVVVPLHVFEDDADKTGLAGLGDDGINAAQKVEDYTPTIEINGGDITVDMGAGDTDALDSNGYLYITGGVVNINAQSPFDYDMGGELTGGEVYVNGSQITELYGSMMGGHGGGMMGGPGGMGGGPGFGG